MGTLKRKFGIALMLAMMCSPLLADEAISPAESHLVKSGSTITRRFTSASGLKAIVADNGKESRLFYLTPDGKNIILGAIFDANGANVTAKDLAQIAVKEDVPSVNRQSSVDPKVTSAGLSPDATDLPNLLARASKLTWIADGNKGKVVYAIFDPNCMYCHQMHGEFREAIAAGKIQVRWIPVSILAASGNSTIAAIYASQNRADALQQAFNHILPGVPISGAADQAMARNVLLLRDTGYAGVPLLLYQQEGKAVMYKGMPDEQTMSSLVRS